MRAVLKDVYLAAWLEIYWVGKKEGPMVESMAAEMASLKAD